MNDKGDQVLLKNLSKMWKRGRVGPRVGGEECPGRNTMNRRAIFKGW